MVAAGRSRERSSIHRSAARDPDDEGDRCIQCALAEGDREGDDFCANLEDRDKETEVLGGAPQTLKSGADFPLGPNKPSTRLIESIGARGELPDPSSPTFDLGGCLLLPSERGGTGLATLD
jgi:hypothetical protein